MIRKMIYGVMLAVLVAFSSLAIACGDDDDDDDGGNGGDATERQEIADLALRLASLNGAEATAEDIEFYLAHITDGFLQEFGTESVEACRADPETCIGEPLPGVTVTADDVDIDGDTARVTANSEFGTVGLLMINEDDEWKADGLFVPDDEIAEGTDVVDVGLEEFAFDFDAEDLSGGDFALHVVNNGEQVHEIILVALPAQGSIEDLLQDETFQPDPIIVKFPYASGDESDVALPAPLDPGRYGFVCFLPDTDDPEGTPHAFLGMAADFTVE